MVGERKERKKRCSVCLRVHDCPCITSPHLQPFQLQARRGREAALWTLDPITNHLSVVSAVVKLLHVNAASLGVSVSVAVSN